MADFNSGWTGSRMSALNYCDITTIINNAAMNTIFFFFEKIIRMRMLAFPMHWQLTFKKLILFFPQAVYFQTLDNTECYNLKLNLLLLYFSFPNPLNLVDFFQSSFSTLWHWVIFPHSLLMHLFPALVWYHPLLLPSNLY